MAGSLSIAGVGGGALANSKYFLEQTAKQYATNLRFLNTFEVLEELYEFMCRYSCRRDELCQVLGYYYYYYRYYYYYLNNLN